MSEPAKTAPDPQAGGRYVRNADGSLTQSPQDRRGRKHQREAPPAPAASVVHTEQE
jgi:hypothetical protein